MRIPVATVIGMVSEGMTEKDILEAYPGLTVEDIREALRYAAEAVMPLRGNLISGQPSEGPPHLALPAVFLAGLNPTTWIRDDGCPQRA